jgi:hypothetical protein
MDAGWGRAWVEASPEQTVCPDDARPRDALTWPGVVISQVPFFFWGAGRGIFPWNEFFFARGPSASGAVGAGQRRDIAGC